MENQKPKQLLKIKVTEKMRQLQMVNFLSMYLSIWIFVNSNLIN